MAQDTITLQTTKPHVATIADPRAIVLRGFVVAQLVRFYEVRRLLRLDGESFEKDDITSDR